MVKMFLKKCGDVLKNITSNITPPNSENNNSFDMKNKNSLNLDNNNSCDSNENRNNNENTFVPEFDINMIMKMKTIMDSMKTNKNDPRANLLKSLKPYLNKNRKNKVDQYIQLFNMSKIFEVINPLGGDNKNDL